MKFRPWVHTNAFSFGGTCLLSQEKLIPFVLAYGNLQMVTLFPESMPVNIDCYKLCYMFENSLMYFTN